MKLCYGISKIQYINFFYSDAMITNKLGSRDECEATIGAYLRAASQRDRRSYREAQLPPRPEDEL